MIMTILYLPLLTGRCAARFDSLRQEVQGSLHYLSNTFAAGSGADDQSSEHSVRGSINPVCVCTQRPSAVRINLKGDVPSVPIPLAKRKPSLKQPAGGGQRVSLYALEKESVEHSGSSFWLVLQQQKPRASVSGITVASSRFSHAAGWFFGKQNARSRRRCAAG